MVDCTVMQRRQNTMSMAETSEDKAEKRVANDTANSGEPPSKKGKKDNVDDAEQAISELVTSTKSETDVKHKLMDVAEQTARKTAANPSNPAPKTASLAKKVAGDPGGDDKTRNHSPPIPATSAAVLSGDDKHNPDTSQCTSTITEMDKDTEEGRLRTFENGGWKCTTLTPKSLARAGFYFVHEPDRVRCFQCQGELEDWCEGDDPLEEHKQNYPKCSFIQKYPSGLQTPREDRKETTTTSTGEDTADTLVNCLPDYYKPVDVKKPYSSFQSRLDTFKSWPVGHPSPSEVAQAGFFYTGKCDQVQCYSCDGILENWGSKDIPWKDHKTFYPYCKYVQANCPYPD